MTRLLCRLFGFIALIVYIGCIFTANWMLQHYGFLPVGFGYQAPAGVFAVGLAFTARDVVQDTLGKRAVLAAILIGAGLSWLVASSFAGASLVAFLLSELADFAVYTPLRERRWLTAVALSNVAGDVIDSCVFLWMAFGSLSFIEGQLIGKYEVTLVLLPLLWLWRRHWHKWVPLHRVRYCHCDWPNFATEGCTIEFSTVSYHPMVSYEDRSTYCTAKSYDYCRCGKRRITDVNNYPLPPLDAWIDLGVLPNAIPERGDSAGMSASDARSNGDTGHGQPDPVRNVVGNG